MYRVGSAAEEPRHTVCTRGQWRPMAGYAPKLLYKTLWQASAASLGKPMGVRKILWNRSRVDLMGERGLELGARDLWFHASACCSRVLRHDTI